MIVGIRFIKTKWFVIACRVFALVRQAANRGVLPRVPRLLDDLAAAKPLLHS